MLVGWFKSINMLMSACSIQYSAWPLRVQLSQRMSYVCYRSAARFSNDSILNNSFDNGFQLIPVT